MLDEPPSVVETQHASLTKSIVSCEELPLSGHPFLLQQRLLRASKSALLAYRTFVGVFQSVIPLIMVLACLIHFYATAGNAMFGHLDCCSADDADFCRPLFGSFLLSMSTLYAMIIQADWSDLMDNLRHCRATLGSSVSERGSDWYFLIWVFFVNQVLMNLFVAMVTHGHFAMKRVAKQEKFSLLVKMHHQHTTVTTHHDDDHHVSKVHRISHGSKSENLVDMRAKLKQSGSQRSLNILASGLMVTDITNKSDRHSGDNIQATASSNTVAEQDEPPLEEEADWEWTVRREQHNTMFNLIRSELSLIDPAELAELDRVCNAGIQLLHRTKRHMSLKEIDSSTLVAAITQFAQSECDEQTRGWSTRKISRPANHFKELWHKGALARSRLTRPRTPEAIATRESPASTNGEDDLGQGKWMRFTATALNPLLMTKQFDHKY